MTDDDRRLMQETIAAGVRASNQVIVQSMAGVMFSLSVLARELIRQKALDEDEFLATIGIVRTKLVTPEVDPYFAKAFESMTSAILKSGDDTPEWLDELLRPQLE